MILYILLALSMLPMLLIPVFAEEYVIFSDKTNYNYGDTVTIFGTSPYANYPFNTSFFNSDTNSMYNGYTVTDSKGNFEFTNPVGLVLQVGNYTVGPHLDDIYLSVHITVHDITIPLLNIVSDKQEYYNNQDINISGTSEMSDDENISRTVDVKLLYPDGTEILSYYTDMNRYGAFTGTLSVTDKIEDNYNGYMIINATFQDYYNTAVIHYSDEEDMSSEANYQRYMELKETFALLGEKSALLEGRTTLLEEATDSLSTALDRVRNILTALGGQ